MCSEPGCDLPVFVRIYGLCKTHYHRFKRTGGTVISREPPSVVRVCSVDGCGRGTKAKGLCGTHYGYKQRYGSPTPELKKVGGQKKENLGVIYGKDGYVYVWDREKQKVFLQHRVVMESIIGRPLISSESVHHKNGQRKDNRPENLELWSKTQPAGQRVEEKCNWAIEILKLYRPEVLNGL